MIASLLGILAIVAVMLWLAVVAFKALPTTGKAALAIGGFILFAAGAGMIPTKAVALLFQEFGWKLGAAACLVILMCLPIGRVTKVGLACLLVVFAFFGASIFGFAMDGMTMVRRP